MARIFVIDDDEQLLRMVGLMLERGGHNVTLISDPQEGFNHVRSDKPDLLVLDVMMPGLSGHELTRKIREEKGLGKLPVLILTARSQEIDRKTALQSGADDYLSKPVTSQELIERVDKLLSIDKQGAVAKTSVIIAFYGFRGGVGQTTLAVNLAAALRRLTESDVCLVDLAVSGGQAANHLRLQARTTWVDIPPEFDWPILKEHLTIHPSGLRLLAAPRTPQLPLTPSAEKTEMMLSLLKENMLFTIIDLPSVFSPAFQAALSASYMALHVITPDVIAVQTASRLNRALIKAGINIRYRSHLINHTTPEAQLTQANIERGLKAKVAFQVEHDGNQLRALAQGVPLVLTSANSPMPVAIRRMAEAIWQRVNKTS